MTDARPITTVGIKFDHHLGDWPGNVILRRKFPQRFDKVVTSGMDLLIEHLLASGLPRGSQDEVRILKFGNRPSGTQQLGDVIDGIGVPIVIFEFTTIKKSPYDSFDFAWQARRSPL